MIYPFGDMNAKITSYDLSIVERIKLIMEISDLEILGLSKLTGISDAHIYSLLNGRRKLTDDIAEKIGSSLDFDGMLIFKLNKEIPASISRSNTLLKFREEHKLNTEYFSSTKVDRKGSAFFEYELLPTSLFEEPKYTWEVKDACKRYGRNYTSNEVNGYLKYLVVRKLLRSEKRSIKLRTGGFGERLVDVFYNYDLKTKQE